MSSARPTEPRESPATKPTCSAISKARPFIVGGLSGCIATCCIQPVDMVKVRLQLVGEGGAKASTSPVQVLKSVLKNEGVLALYKGLDAGITRQVRLLLICCLNAGPSSGTRVKSTSSVHEGEIRCRHCRTAASHVRFLPCLEVRLLLLCCGRTVDILYRPPWALPSLLRQTERNVKECRPHSPTSASPALEKGSSWPGCRWSCCCCWESSRPLPDTHAGW